MDLANEVQRENEYTQYSEDERRKIEEWEHLQELWDEEEEWRERMREEERNQEHPLSCKCPTCHNITYTVNFDIMVECPECGQIFHPVYTE